MEDDTKHNCAPGVCWHADNHETERELKIIESGQGGPEFEQAVASFSKRLCACADHSYDFLVSSGYYNDIHPAVLKVGMHEIRKALQLNRLVAHPGRPLGDGFRNAALVDAILELKALGYGVAEACEEVAEALLTKDGVAGHTDNLTARSIQRIYQSRDKSDE